MAVSKRRKIGGAILAVAVLVGGAAFGARFLGGGTHVESPADGAAGAAVPRPVQLARVEQRPVERLVDVVGALSTLEEATLRVKVAGRLSEVRVDFGERIGRGEVVARIEPDDYQLHVERAKAQLAQAVARLGLKDHESPAPEMDRVSVVRQARATLHEAQRQLERFKKLSAPGIVSDADLDSAEVAVEIAEGKLEDAIQEARHRLATLAEQRAALAIAEQELQETTIYAPFDASVTRRVAHPGEYLHVGDPVLTLVRTDRVRLRLEIPERLASRVAIGQSLRFQLDPQGNSYHANVERISPVIEPGNRMLVVEASVANAGELRPGSFVRGQIVVEPESPALTVPAAALTSFAGIYRVFVVENGRAVEREVSLGQRGDEWVEVHGLARGEAVVLDPGNLRAGTEVQPAVAAPAAVAALRDAR